MPAHGASTSTPATLWQVVRDDIAVDCAIVDIGKDTVVGTFLAFLALGLQAPVTFAQAADVRRLSGPSLAIIRVTAVVLLAAATAMIGSRYP